MQVRAEAVTMLATGKPEMLACLRSTGLEHPPAAMRGKVEKTEWHHSATISRQVLIMDKRAVLCLPRPPKFSVARRQIQLATHGAPLLAPSPMSTLKKAQRFSAYTLKH